MKLTKQQRADLKQKYGGRCAYCGDELGDRWHADHANPVIRISRPVKCEDGRYRHKQTGEVHFEHRDTVENLMPACASCNIYKHFDTIEQFRYKINNTLRAMSRHTCYKFAKKYGLVQETGGTIKFFFETYQGTTP